MPSGTPMTMKSNKGQVTMAFVSPPEGTPTLSERFSLGSVHDQVLKGPHWPQDHDRRPAVAAHGMLQRTRARLMQPISNVDTHVRTRRRPRDSGSA